jgi:hypothetical protein
MNAWMRSWQGAVIFGLMASLNVGCGGSDPVETAQSETVVTKEPKVVDNVETDEALPFAGEHDEPLMDEVEPSVAADDSAVDSGVVRAGGLEETVVSGIRTVAGESDPFDTNSLDGNVLFDEDEDEKAFDEDDGPEEKIVAPKQGTPEYYVSEITKLRVQPLPRIEDPKKLRAAQQQRQMKIVNLAEQAIKLTFKDPKQQRVFDVALGKLLEARLQLAVDGHKPSIDALYEHAPVLYKRDPKSAAAAEGAHTLVQLAFINCNTAAMAGSLKKDPRWLEEFAKQSEDFALKFPKEERRSVPLLFTAAESCEIHGLTGEAIRCHTLIAKKFPKHTATPASIAVLRRLQMVGKRKKLYGTSLAGTKLSLEQFSGRPVVVFFWSTGAQPSLDRIPEVTAALKKYGKNRLGVIGVCLDSKKETVVQYLGKNPQPWGNIFHPDATKRSWNNPIVKFYGVRRLPSMWVIDASGLVATTDVPTGKLNEVLGRMTPARTAAGNRPSRSKN